MFASSEVLDSMKVVDIHRADGKAWDLQTVSHLFSEKLRERVLSFETLIYSSLNIEVCSHSCTLRVVTASLYRFYRRKTTGHRDIRWIWKIGEHLRVSLFL